MISKDILCPHCGYKYNDDDKGEVLEFANNYLNNETNIICCECDYEFKIRVSYIPEFETFKTVEEYEEN